MRDLAYHFSHICDQNRDNWHSTQDRRRRELDLIARQLRDIGYRHVKNAHQIKGRHVNALILLWKEGSAQYKPVTAATMKNRLASLRWVLRKVGREAIMLASNDRYNIERRTYVATESKAQTLSPEALEQIECPYLKLSLRLQAAFGLRRMEAIKFKPSYAYTPGADDIHLKGSWCKGGRPRTVPITDDAQRVLLAQVSALVGSGSLIPAHLKYVDQLRKYEYACSKVGLHKLHGLRHAYAQDRYTELSGLEAPVNREGEVSLTAGEREVDTASRLAVSRELGHNRVDVVGAYIGTKRSKLRADEPPIKSDVSG
jgi:integrase